MDLLIVSTNQTQSSLVLGHNKEALVVFRGTVAIMDLQLGQEGIIGKTREGPYGKPLKNQCVS